MSSITTCLWFNKNTEEAVDYYLSVFPNSKKLGSTHYPKDGLADFQKEFAGKVLTIDFELNGQRYMALNAGPEFTFTEAVSFIVNCKDQAEIDHYWSKLSAVPASEQCGWCKDKYGISWQIVPANMDELMKHEGAWEKMMNSKKIVIADFEGGKA